MNEYQKWIKDPEKRQAILRGLGFVPDKWMIRFQYRIKTGRKIDLDRPQRYTEKIQWYKLCYHNPLMTVCADKYLVRTYVAEKGLADILNPLIGVYDSVEEVMITELPDRFVLKTTNGSRTNVFCTDQSSFDWDAAKKQLELYMGRKGKAVGREWAYYGIAPRIVAEQYLDDPDNPYGGINDYKFLCFGGRCRYIVLDVARSTNHRRNIYDAQWNDLHVSTDHGTVEEPVERPERLDDMIEIAERLSAEFPAVRVDLYCVSGQVYFGELTFYPWSGYVVFDPDEFDYELGNQFSLPGKAIEGVKC